MILTEEQWDVLLRAAHVLRYYVNDPDSIFRADQIKEDTIVLQAMIDSSEHVTDHTKMIGFDLEKARELVWAASERRIWTPPGGTGYGLDLDKHREWQAVVEICDKQFPSAIAEIGRLLADAERYETVLDARRNVIDQQAARIKDLEADVLQKSLLCDSIAENCNSLRNRAWKAEARIEGLEDALVEERASRVYYEDSCPFRLWNDIKLKDKFLREARQQLQAESKIGPDADAKPRVWQITEERKAAIENAISSCVLIERYTGQDLQHETAVLRTMLREG